MAFVLAAVASESASAVPRLICYPIVPGDTVTAISVRLTRDPQSWRGDGFQIFDPATARFVPRATTAIFVPAGRHAWPSPSVAGSQALRPASSQMGWWILILLCSAAIAALFVIQSSLDQRKATIAALQTFGAAFIREFERPLLDQRGSRSVLRAELALSPDRGSLEVRLAPTDGRRYPNLSDHRTNVEYDVERVMNLLNDRRFICGPLRARGSWVAIPVRLKPDLHKEGDA